ncbi:RIP metalloprotease RseP [Altererythrobacter fulvus]|uniref:RIP metalloprotease RseP n=1 Tax=Caenibius fulvus TaxID=2126012 RepID=UPI003017EC39
MASPPFWMWIVGFLLVLGPLVTVHELGHYLVGRWFGVKADVFSIGFGKELTGWTDRRGTRWRISALPLGGYVQFAGDMNPASQPSAEWLALPYEERRKTFQAKSLWQRALIVAAGPVTNLLVAVAIFAAFNLAYGKPVPADPAQSNMVQNFAPQSPAREAGMKIGDRIVEIDGEKVARFQDIVDRVALYPNKRIVVGVERDGDLVKIPVKIAASEEADRFGNVSKVGRIGVFSSAFAFEPVGIGESVTLAVGQSVDIVRMMVIGLGQIIAGDRPVSDLGGPIKIAKFSGEQLSLGPLAFVSFVAMISINLAFINLLPIPALDGGHLAFYAAEAVRRKPIGPRSQEWAFRTGVAFVLALMLFVTINDIASLPLFGS